MKKRVQFSPVAPSLTSKPPLGYDEGMNSCIYCDAPTNNPKFCSISCSAKEQAKSRHVAVVIKSCLYCKENFTISERDKRKVYCSRSCAARANNSLRGKEHLCKRCGAGLGKNAKNYCSHVCQQAWQTEQKIERWLSGDWNPESEYAVPGVIRKYLLTQANNQCTLCKWSELHPVTGKCPLQIDHIDGNASNNRPENLRVLCPNCHSLTPNFGALNKGNGRSYRYASLA